jgi:hypothetical protein
MHRPAVTRLVGALGGVIGAFAIVLLIGAHLGAAAIALSGFSALFAVAEHGGEAPRGALLVLDAGVAGWSGLAAFLLATGRLSSR